jgi:hypothetical protein
VRVRSTIGSHSRRGTRRRSSSTARHAYRDRAPPTPRQASRRTATSCGSHPWSASALPLRVVTNDQVHVLSRRHPRRSMVLTPQSAPSKLYQGRLRRRPLIYAAFVDAQASEHKRRRPSQRAADPQRLNRRSALARRLPQVIGRTAAKLGRLTCVQRGRKAPKGRFAVDPGSVPMLRARDRMYLVRTGSG